MKHTGPRFGIMTWTYNVATDEREYGVLIGWGKFVIWPNRYYTRFFQIKWHPLASCFHWWVEYLGYERGNVVVQYRICGFRRWPVEIDYGKNE